MAWTKTVSLEMEKRGLKDIYEVELTGLDDRLYLRDEKARGNPRMAPRSWVCDAIEIGDIERKAGL